MTDSDYISTLSYDEKIVFLKIFCCLVRADGKIEADEISFLKDIAGRYGIDNNTVVSIIKEPRINYVDEARKIKSRQHALQLVKEMCVLANIDNDLADNELDIVIDSARAMGIEDNKIVLINRWVLDSLILSKTGEIIMERDNG
ncbi:MAG: hypothetical protein IKR92_04935 [Alphaproteobacteria bacterium]|nr:hypothetical protein [Alphaproteobacteria bacterium]